MTFARAHRPAAVAIKASTGGSSTRHLPSRDRRRDHHTSATARHVVLCPTAHSLPFERFGPGGRSGSNSEKSRYAHAIPQLYRDGHPTTAFEPISDLRRHSISALMLGPAERKKRIEQHCFPLNSVSKDFESWASSFANQAERRSWAELWLDRERCRVGEPSRRIVNDVLAATRLGASLGPCHVPSALATRLRRSSSRRREVAL